MIFSVKQNRHIFKAKPTFLLIAKVLQLIANEGTDSPTYGNFVAANILRVHSIFDELASPAFEFQWVGTSLGPNSVESVRYLWLTFSASHGDEMNPRGRRGSKTLVVGAEEVPPIPWPAEQKALQNELIVLSKNYQEFLKKVNKEKEVREKKKKGDKSMMFLIPKKSPTTKN